jgi:hypothetical protein
LRRFGLALSEPGSAEESKAVDSLAVAVEKCFNAGETPVVDLPSLRALTSIALYRGVSYALSSGS